MKIRCNKTNQTTEFKCNTEFSESSFQRCVSQKPITVSLCLALILVTESFPFPDGQTFAALDGLISLITSTGERAVPCLERGEGGIHEPVFNTLTLRLLCFVFAGVRHLTSVSFVL